MKISFGECSTKMYEGYYNAAFTQRMKLLSKHDTEQKDRTLDSFAVEVMKIIRKHCATV